MQDPFFVLSGLFSFLVLYCFAATKKEIFDKYGEAGLKSGCCTFSAYTFSGNAREMFCNIFGDMFSDGKLVLDALYTHM